MCLPNDIDTKKRRRIFDLRRFELTIVLTVVLIIILIVILAVVLVVLIILVVVFRVVLSAVLIIHIVNLRSFFGYEPTLSISVILCFILGFEN